MLLVHLAVGPVLAAVLRALAGKDAVVEAEAEVDRRVGGEPVDERGREHLPEPRVVLALRDLDDVAAVELHRLEAADVLARAAVVRPVEERRLEPLRPHREHRQVADRLGDAADHDRVLLRDVHAEGLAVERLVAKPPGDAAGKLSGHRPARMPDPAGLLARQRHARPDQLGPDHQAALGRIGLELRLGPVESVDCRGSVHGGSLNAQRLRSGRVGRGRDGPRRLHRRLDRRLRIGLRRQGAGIGPGRRAGSDRACLARRVRVVRASRVCGSWSSCALAYPAGPTHSGRSVPARRPSARSSSRSSRPSRCQLR